ncbi:hypothetical protein SBOR_9906 [Sclerotinia borealis F-4128]|uniref:Uncharacterized protein n=1 Tax=Sclerotinia borealis (strain F-4128) TaxID=1432307 RepID=W9BYN1_SCLBF|nr:hypothetical protein SBOR_9906 [Sclerotinia borealis F-4128]
MVKIGKLCDSTEAILKAGVPRRFERQKSPSEESDASMKSFTDTGSVKDGQFDADMDDSITGSPSETTDRSAEEAAPDFLGKWIDRTAEGDAETQEGKEAKRAIHEVVARTNAIESIEAWKEELKQLHDHLDISSKMINDMRRSLKELNRTGFYGVPEQ